MPVQQYASYQQAREAIQRLEDDTKAKFVLFKRRGEMDRTSVTHLPKGVLWHQSQGELQIPSSTVPFIQMGTETWECQNGPCHKKKKDKKHCQSEHNYGVKRRRHVQDSKKLDCPMRIRVTVVIRFLEYELTSDISTIRRRTETAAQLHQNFDASTVQQTIAYVAIIGDHANHVTGDMFMMLGYSDSEIKVPKFLNCLGKTFIRGLKQKLAGYGLPIDQGVKEKIWSLVLEDGVKDAALIKQHIDLLHPETLPSDRRFHPSPQDIRNHVHIALNQNRYSQDDQENVVRPVDTWKAQSPDDSYYFRPTCSKPSEPLTTLLFIHQSKFQKRLLQKYGNDVVLLDSTYSTTRYELPLLLMCVLTNVGYYVVASFIIGKETQAQIKEALEVIKSWNPHVRPKAFMTDLDQREIGAIQFVYPESSLHICQFHREQAWSRWLNKISNGAHQSKENALKQIVADTLIYGTP